MIEVLAPELVFAVLFLAGAAWFARGGAVAAAVALALLFAVELLGVPFYELAAAVAVIARGRTPQAA